MYGIAKGDSLKPAFIEGNLDFEVIFDTVQLVPLTYDSKIVPNKTYTESGITFRGTTNGSPVSVSGTATADVRVQFTYDSQIDCGVYLMDMCPSKACTLKSNFGIYWAWYYLHGGSNDLAEFAGNNINQRASGGMRDWPLRYNSAPLYYTGLTMIFRVSAGETLPSGFSITPRLYKFTRNPFDMMSKKSAIIINSSKPQNVTDFVFCNQYDLAQSNEVGIVLSAYNNDIYNEHYSAVNGKIIPITNITDADKISICASIEKVTIPTGTSNTRTVPNCFLVEKEKLIPGISPSIKYKNVKIIQ